jgi:hypothetical protein
MRTWQATPVTASGSASWLRSCGSEPGGREPDDDPDASFAVLVTAAAAGKGSG